jgi:gamma-glutamylcyclotransferase (GGCT)/AIG2-like uncharacterized protein YtfP
MTGTNLFAFYGSLRKGMENFKAYQSDLKYLKTRRIAGFELYALEEYPYAVKTDVFSQMLVVEVFEIEDQRVAETIHQMELEAGYIFELIEVDGEKVGIYLFEQSEGDSKVESGDWVEFFGSNKQ